MTTADPGKKWLTIPDVCARLNLTTDEWQLWNDAGDMPPQLIGPDGQPLIRADHLGRWLDGRTFKQLRELDPADWRTARAEYERGHQDDDPNQDGDE